MLMEEEGRSELKPKNSLDALTKKIEKGMSLEEYLDLCYIIANENKFLDFNSNKIAGVCIIGKYSQACLIYEHVQQCICSAYEALDDKEMDLFECDRKQIVSSIQDYWHLSQRDQKKLEDKEVIKKYYQNMIDYEIEGNVFHNLRKDRIYLKLDELVKPPFHSKEQRKQVPKFNRQEIENRIEQKVKPALMKLFKKKEIKSAIIKSEMRQRKQNKDKQALIDMLL